MPAWKLWVMMALAVVGGGLLVWRSLVDGLWIGMTGRPWIFLGCLGLYLFGPCLFSFVVGRSENPWHSVLRWWPCAAVLVKGTAAAVLARALVRRGLLTRAALAKILGAWMAAVVGLFLVLYALYPSDPDWEYGLRAWVQLLDALVPTDLGPAGQVAVVAVLLVPLARLAAAPLALDWNRHR
jgi:hypothetical protein